jgi:hypothetical protein
MGVDTLLLEVGPKVVKADMDLFGELAQIGPTWSEPGMFGPLFPLFKPEVIRLEVSMTIGVVRGV